MATIVGVSEIITVPTNVSNGVYIATPLESKTRITNQGHHYVTVVAKQLGGSVTDLTVQTTQYWG